jgi:hypothetical protein
MYANELFEKILTKLDGAGKPEVLELLEPATVADLLHVKSQTLSLWRHKGMGPDYVKIGSCVRYSKKAVISYVTEQTVTL